MKRSVRKASTASSRYFGSPSSRSFSSRSSSLFWCGGKRSARLKIPGSAPPSLAARHEAERKAKEEAAKAAVPEPRFSTLNALDSKRTRPREEACSKVASLRELCEKFPRFCRREDGALLRYCYHPRIYCGLAVSHIIILQGMSGTGKTSLAYAFGEFLGNPSVIIPVQPMWKERTDLLGYYNEFTHKYNETLLLQKMYEAERQTGDVYRRPRRGQHCARRVLLRGIFVAFWKFPTQIPAIWMSSPTVGKTIPAALKNGRIKIAREHVVHRHGKQRRFDVCHLRQSVRPRHGAGFSRQGRGIPCG